MELIQVSPSRTSVYKRCPKKYHLAYNRNLKRIEGRQRHFDKGLYFHELSHVYYDLLQQGIKPGSDFALSSIQARIRQDIENNPTADLTIILSVQRSITRFITEQSPQIDEGIKVVGTEQEINVPFVLPSGREIELFGFVDLVYRDRFGSLRIRDHKSGDRPKRESSVEANPQIVHYGCAYFVELGETPTVEISWTNTKEYKNKATASDKMFMFKAVPYTKAAYEIALLELGQLLDEMLDSPPTPHYEESCDSCPFWDICRLEKKGVSPERIIQSNYKVVDRAAIREEITFTDEDAHEY